MKRRRGALFLVGLGAAAVTCFVWSSGPKEPVYQGKTITQWILQANDVGIFEQSDELKAAMIAFGTNAVPFLLEQFTKPVPHWKEHFTTWFNRHPFYKMHMRTKTDRIRVAGNGLELLETNAAPALPVLVRYLDDPERDEFVKSIFCNAGDDALPHLADVLASTNAVAITNVIETLQRMAHRSDPARRMLDTASAGRSGRH